MDVEVVELKLIGGSSRSLKGVTDVKNGDLTIFNWKVARQENHGVSGGDASSCLEGFIGATPFPKSAIYPGRASPEDRGCDPVGLGEGETGCQ